MFNRDEAQKISRRSGPGPARTSADPGGSARERARVGAGQASLPAEPEGEGLTVASVVGTQGGGWKHGGYTILAGRVDGRSAVARRMRRLAEQIARDAAYDTFQAMPAVRQAAVMQFCRVVAASDAMWSAFLHSGRLPDKFWELASLTRKYAELLTLQRVLKSANVLTLEEIRSRYDGEAVTR